MQTFNVKQYAVPFKKNEVLLYGNGKEEWMFLILSGRVGIYKRHASGQTIVCEISSGEFVGAVPFFSGVSEDHRVIAREKTIAVKIDVHNIDLFIAAHPQLIVKLMANLSEQLREENEVFSQRGIEEVTYSEGLEFLAPDILKGRMYPMGHLKYPKKISEHHLKYLFDKTVTCPVCDNSFSIYQIRWSKLKLIENRRDFRKIYDGFDESWYEIWSCPHCHYSNFHYEFFKVTGLQKMDLKQKLLHVNHKSGKSNLLKKNYDEVFQVYYLALACKTIMGSSSFEMGRLWLRLAWLYQDCKHTEMYKIAYSQARQYFCDGWFNTPHGMDVMEEQKLCILIGEMFIAEQDYDNAKTFFFKGINNLVGSKTMNLIARNRLEDVNEMVLVTDK